MPNQRPRVRKIPGRRLVELDENTTVRARTESDVDIGADARLDL